MKICLNFLNCHLAKAWSSLFSCVTDGSKRRQAVAGETGLLYNVPISLLCCWQPSLRKETTLVSGVEFPGPVRQWLTKQRSSCYYCWNVSSPQPSTLGEVWTWRERLSALHWVSESAPNTQYLAHGVFSINVCWMNEWTSLLLKLISSFLPLLSPLARRKTE